MGRPWVGMPPKLREDIHRQLIHNCCIIIKTDNRRHIREIEALRSIVAWGGPVHKLCFYSNGQIIVADAVK